MYGDLLTSKGQGDKAYGYYLSAAERGDWEARVKVASFSTSGEDIVKRLADLYERTLISGNGMMEYRYADLLIKTAWNDADRRKAFEMYLKSASDGYIDSLHQVALMYRDGLGVSKDYVKMIEYLEMAADKGLMHSITLLADIYGQGKLLPKDRDMSFKWTLRAAEFGNREFMYRVAIMYRDGIGTEINKEESNKWFNRYREAYLFQHYAWATNYERSCNDCNVEQLYDAAIGTMNSGMIYQLMIFTKDSSKKE
jgi:hypothetical protein